MQDELLCKRAAKGDAEAFLSLVEPFEQKLYFLCLGLVKNPDDAKDCVQEALLKAYRGIARFNADSALSTWLYRIAYHACIDTLRKRKPQIPIAELSDSGDLPDSSPLPYEQLEARERKRLLNAAIQSLPEDFRAPLLLYIQGEDYAAIADILSIKLGTVKSRINRARERLRETLSPDRELFTSASVKSNERGQSL